LEYNLFDCENAHNIHPRINQIHPADYTTKTSLPEGSTSAAMITPR
jgi:hypothetical protein